MYRHRDAIPKECIGEEQWRPLLAHLEPVERPDDYWIQQFLKNALQVMPDAVICFLQNRLQRAEVTENWPYSPLTKPYKEGERLGLLTLGDRARYLRSLLDWAIERADDSVSLRRFGDVMAGLCGDYDQTVLHQLLQWMTGGSERHARVVAAVLGEAQHDIFSGVRSTTPGEPFPEDVRMENHASV